MGQGDDFDPFGGERSKTILRKPDGGPRSATPYDPPRPPLRAAPVQPHPAPRNQGPTAALSDFLSHGHNALLGAAAPLLMLGAQLRNTAQPPDVDALRRQAMQEVRAFEQRAREAGVPDDPARIGRYVLCTFVDLAVFATPWGSLSQWPAQSLLSAFEREAFGGEKFLQIFEIALAEPERFRDVIELQYFCLALGLELGSSSSHSVELKQRELQDRALDVLRRDVGAPSGELSAHWQGVKDRRNPVRDVVPWWMAALAGLLVVFGGYVYWRGELSAEARPIKVALAREVAPAPYVPPPTPEAPSRLKTLLEPQQQQGLLVVEDYGDHALVTLTVAELFRSASATVDPSHVGILAAIGDAARDVGGQLVVVGHTDDLPIRSLRFQDNFELSRARAMAVAQILDDRLGGNGRVEWKGVGDTQPKYTPVDSAANRARNRRVEILHLPERVTP